MSSKTAIVVLSDPTSGGEEALGRVFNALATAWDYAQSGEALLVFQGAGTRWPEVLADPTHPANEVYRAVRDQVATVASCGCSAVFGATEGVDAAGIDRLKTNPAPGTPGVASLRALRDEGFTILTF